MKIRVERRALLMAAAAAATGALSGLINGFLGAGSGVLLMYTVALFNSVGGRDASKDNFATVVACVLPLALVSVVTYTRGGAADGALVGRFAIPAILGGVLGAMLTERLDAKILRIIFGVVVIIGGINMI